VIEGKHCSSLIKDKMVAGRYLNKKYDKIAKPRTTHTRNPLKTGRTTSIVACEVHALPAARTSQKERGADKHLTKALETNKEKTKLPLVSISTIQANLIASVVTEVTNNAAARHAVGSSPNKHMNNVLATSLPTNKILAKSADFEFADQMGSIDIAKASHSEPNISRRDLEVTNIDKTNISQDDIEKGSGVDSDTTNKDQNVEVENNIVTVKSRQIMISSTNTFSPYIAAQQLATTNNL
jgi:hypothetical protein